MNNQETFKKCTGAIIRGSIAQVPLVGSLAVELLTAIIPNQRQERIEKLLNIVASRVFDLDPQQLKEKFNSPDFIDIFEDILLQSVRATSNERLEYLASVIDYGLRQEEIEHLKIKRLLELLHEINNVEVIVLQSYDLKNIRDRDFKQKHQAIFHCEFIADSEASAEKREQQAMLESYKNHLITLGLIGLVDLRGQAHHESRLFITQLGAMMLKTIGLEKEPIAIGKAVSPLAAIEMAGKGHQEIEKKMKPKEDTFRKTESQKAREDVEKLTRDIRF